MPGYTALGVQVQIRLPWVLYILVFKPLILPTSFLHRLLLAFTLRTLNLFFDFDLTII